MQTIASSPMTSLCRSARLLSYLTQAEQVEGWMSNTTALGMLEVADMQEQKGISGNLAEIGIHHGKSFLVLAGAARAYETVFAIDVFEHQELNIDHSGEGNRKIFEANVRRFFPGTRVSVIARSSTDVRGREAEFGLMRLRFLSIDGGHTPELTYNDLEIADTTLVEGGACVLDDVLNAHWTGVITGLFRFLSDCTTLVPAALLLNKLLLCRPAFRDAYASHLRTTLDFALERTNLPFHASQIDVYGERWPEISATFISVLTPLLEQEKAKVRDANAQTTERLRLATERIAELEREADRAASLAQQLMEQTALAEARSAMIRDLQDSTSWRVTAPLRAVGRVFQSTTHRDR